MATGTSSPARVGEAIVHGIVAATKVFVLVFSAHANASHQITREVERAVHHGIPIIPFRIENVQPTDLLEYFISTPHWLDAFAPPMEQHLAYLVSVVQHLMQGTDAHPARSPSRPSPPFWRLLSVTAIALQAGVGMAGAWGGLDHAAARRDRRALDLDPAAVGRRRDEGGVLDTAAERADRAALTGPKAALDFEDNDTGLYRARYVGEDQGQVTADGRGLTFTSAVTGKLKGKGLLQRHRFRQAQDLLDSPVHSPRRLRSWRPGLWQFMWVGRQDPAAAAYSVPGDIVGSWRNTFVSTPVGQIWSAEMTIDAAGHYTLRFTRNESGQFEASKGHWKRTPTISGVGVPGMPDQGSYKFQGRDLITYTSPLGSVTYRRVGPYEEPKT